MDKNYKVEAKVVDQIAMEQDFTTRDFPTWGRYADDIAGIKSCGTMFNTY